MNLNEIIYDVREKLKLGSDDIDVSDEYIAHLINVKRAFLLKQRYTKFSKTIPEETKQIICVTLEEVNSIDGQSCLGTILRSKDKLPILMQLDNKPALIAVRTYDLINIPINIVSIERLPFVLSNKWLRNQIFVAIDSDTRVYFTSGNLQHKFLEQVKIIGIFEDPEEADTKSCETATCEYYEKPYSIEAHMVHDVVNLVVKEMIPSLQIPEDKLNNSDESPR